jgi:hypothetical protein
VYALSPCSAVCWQVAECEVLLLHLLSALLDKLLEPPRSAGVPSRLNISILSRAALRKEVLKRLQPTDVDMSSAESFAGPPLAPVSSAAPATSIGAVFQPLLLSSKAADSPLHIRLCDSWTEAVMDSEPLAQGAPLRALYLPSLSWLCEETDQETRSLIMQQMLTPVGATLYPPESWDRLLEQKDQIYSRLNAYMLPAVWISLDAVNGDVSKLAVALLRTCKKNGRYFVKGSCSQQSICADPITVRNRSCSVLVSILQRYVNVHHQRSVGIQPFSKGFEDLELRTWLIPDPDTNQWRSVLTIKTNTEPGSPSWSAQLFQPLHTPGLRVARLIERMLAEECDFFEQVRRLGVPALRIDCGYDPDLGPSEDRGAFLSEFASAPDGIMWTDTHGQDLAYVIGRAMGDGVWKTMLKGH